ncbi:hypothetical protein CR205_16135 [Alteribacter lacisalsi]|uniref:O-antigen ligase-related domain-containing protein n=1 Tax=Alteribacter lacisalsi TaxID=2045244 RepID=A0A2W0H409_9BACI|nr:O-antigen ligase family protein [Alteribacter lacisalsi]PYZ95907.1 hypothetical protein CR205_16135 [Alteribacter lacisalsi]
MLTFFMFLFVHRRRITFSRMHASLAFWTIGMTIVTAIGFLYANDAYRVMTYLKDYYMGVLLVLLLLLSIRTEASMNRLLWTYLTLTFSVAVISLAAYGFYLTGGTQTLFVSIDSVSVRSTGLFGNPNYYGMSLLMSLAAAAVLLKRNGKKKLLAIMLAVFTVTAVLTMSRGTWISVGSMYAIWGLLALRPLTKKKMAVLASVPALAVITAVFFRQMAPGTGVHPLFARLTDFDFTIREGRFYLWEQGFHLVMSQPAFIFFGVGGNQFHTYSEAGITNYVHNGYLNFAYENGIFGILLLLALTIFLFSRVRSGRAFANPFAIGIIGFYVMSLSNDVFRVREFWFAVAILLLFYQQEKNRQKVHSESIQNQTSGVPQT